MLGLNYGPDHDPLAILEQRDRGAISVYAQGDDYHELIKPRLKDDRALADRAGRRRREGVRRHRRGDGKAARGRRRPRLAGQAHQSRLARVRLVAVSRRDLHHARTAAGRSRDRITAAPATPASTSARPRRFPRPTGSMRGAASPTSPSSTKGRSRASFAPLMGNRIYGCDDCLAVCPWNKFAQQGREAKLAARDVAARAGARRARAARRRGVPRAVRQDRGEAHRPRPLHPQCADRDRQLRRSDRWRRRPSGCWPTPRRWCAAPRCGRSAGSIRRGSTPRAGPCRRDRSRRRRGMGRRRLRERDRLGSNKNHSQGETSWPHSRAAPCLPDLPQPPRCGPSVPSRPGRSATFP